MKAFSQLCTTGFTTLCFLLIGTISQGHAQTFSTWITSSNGNWDDGTNWSTNPIFPNSPGSSATFIGANIESAAPLAVRHTSTPGDITIGSLQINIANGVNINLGTNLLNFDNMTNATSPFITVSGGQSTIASTLNLVSGNNILEIDFDESPATSPLPSSLTISGSITGSSSTQHINISNLNHTAAGNGIFFSGVNSFLGPITVNCGLLHLNSTSGNSINGDLIILGPQSTVQTQKANQFNSLNSNVTVNGGTLDLDGNDQAILSLTIQADGAVTDTNTLSSRIQTSSTTMLGGSHINNVDLMTDGPITYNNSVSNNGIATINISTINLSSLTETIDIELNAQSNLKAAQLNEMDFFIDCDMDLINTTFTNGSLLKEGAGTLLLDVGTTIVPLEIQAGQVLIAPGANIKALHASTTVDNGNGASFGGFGFIGGKGYILINNGLVEPGNGSTTGILTINGDYAQNASGTLKIKANTVNGFTYTDILDVTGSTTLSGTLIFEALPNALLTPGKFVVLNSKRKIQGTFSSFTAILPSNLNASFSVTDHQVIVTLKQACPTPCKSCVP